jgi:hypothetical protein
MVTEEVKEVEKWIKGIFSDPLVKKMLEKCHLTKIQLETVLIDILSDEMVGKQIKKQDKTLFRKKQGKISRGSYNRSLKQGLTNIEKSINTIILLGYLGVFESTKFVKLIEFSTKLHSYIQMYKTLWNTQQSSTKIEKKKLEEIRIFQSKLLDEFDKIMNNS